MNAIESQRLNTTSWIWITGWWFASIISAIASIIIVIAVCLFEFCLGRKIHMQNSGNTAQASSKELDYTFPQTEHWPRWLTIKGEEKQDDIRILPWHILLVLASLGYFFLPGATAWCIKGSVILGAFVLVLYVAMYWLNKWFDDHGAPLLYSSDEDDD